MLVQHSTSHTCNVYSMCMSRTNLIIDDELLDRVMRRYGLRTKTKAVDLALRHLAGRPMTTEEALARLRSLFLGKTHQLAP